MDKIKKILPFLVILFLSLPAILPLFWKGYFPMHDDTQPARVYQMYTALKEGQFPVRMVGELGYGYGYPLFNFYAPLPYYIGAIGMAIVLDAVTATKFVFGLGIILSGIFMFLLARRIWGVSGGTVAAILYLYFPYHALQVYIRGALGEYWAYAFLPLVFLGVDIATKKFTPGLLIGSLGLSAVILSHNILGLITAGIIFIWGLWETLRGTFTYIRKTKAFLLVCILILGLSLSAFFWLPAISEMKYTRAHSLIAGSNDFRQHFVYPDQLWDSPWGFAGSGPGRLDGLSFKIGKLHLILGGLGFAALYFLKTSQKDKKPTKLSTGFVLLGGLAVSILMMLPVSQPVWELVPVLAFIQYPWRFLVFVGFYISLLSGAVTLVVKRNGWQIGSAVFISVLAIIVNTKYFQPQTVSDKTASDYTNPEKLRWDISKISDEYLPRDFPLPQLPDEVAQNKFIPADDIIITSTEIRADRIKLNTVSPGRADIAFSVANFPGWQAVVDYQEVKPKIVGRTMVIPVSHGNHIVSLYFTDTRVRRLGNWISILGMLVVLVMYQNIKFQRNEEN